MNIKGKALLAGCIALAFSNMALAEDIKVAVVGAMSGPVAQYGDQEFTGAEQAVADINAKGGIKGNKLQIVNMTMPVTRNRRLRWRTKSLTTALNM